MGVPRGLAATIARLQSCIQDARRGKSRDVHIQGINVGVGVPGTGRLGASQFENRKRQTKVEEGRTQEHTQDSVEQAGVNMGCSEHSAGA